MKLISYGVIALLLLLTPTLAKTSNESSYQYGYMVGSSKSPNININTNEYPQLHDYTCELTNASVTGGGAILPAVTNITACQNGFFAGWKDLCINHAVNCIGNITSGYLPDLLLKIHRFLLFE
jgi:hypothetical protein